MKFQKTIFFFSLLILGFLASCQKNEVLDTSPNLTLNFSTDSVLFDTVFTSLGSATRRLMVYNPSHQKIKISDIALAGGEQSPFRINIDGNPAPDQKDVELAGGDSLYIFARVTINPTNVNNPFVVEDSILFQINGNNQTVRLVAWGQNAHYIVADHTVPGFPSYKIVADSLQTTRWTNDKPYVVYGYAVVNSYGKLEIQPGTHIYFHKNSGLWIYANGQLTAQGTIDEPIVFQGDRLESDYADIPGQWDRIWIMEGKSNQNNTLENAIIKNGYIGIQAESFFKKNENKLVLKNVVIQNMDGAGILSRNYTIEGQNLVVANCGGYCLALTDGGSYHFIQSTIANYWPYSIRNNPAVMLTNFVTDSNNQAVPNNLSFNLGNSIIYGYNDNEFGTQMVAGADSSYFLDHCLVKTTRNTGNTINFNEIIKNTDPKFKDVHTMDFRLDTLSPAIGKGSLAIGSASPYDILGNTRGALPDLGAYQFVPGQRK
ncbi:MAG: hypothetical protein JXR71_01780 [Bacteroidales bacterium]|nr:hypothetical protein [Bacteroidales bacterium]